MKKAFMKRIISATLCFCLMIGLYSPAVSAATTVNYRTKTMSQILNLDEDLTWVFTGDSITHNANWTAGYNDYASWFEQYLYDLGRDGDTLINTAWGGATIEHFQPDYTATVGMGTYHFITKYNPDVVFIKLGMNNRATATSTFTTLYENMLDAIDEAGQANGKIPKIVILTPTPLSGEFGSTSGEVGADPTTEGYLDSVSRFVPILQNIATERGLEFINLRQAMIDESLVLGDEYHYTFFSDPSDGRIHPNGAGQYFMFKTICKGLGVYDESNTIFQVEYADILDAVLYSDDTAVDYPGLDNSEMNQTMPEPAKLIASVDFTNANGEFVYNADDINAGTVDLTQTATGVNTLTLKEAQSLGKEYSVVFRAKLGSSVNLNQPIFYMAGTSTGGFKSQSDVIMMGMPGVDNETTGKLAEMYYYAYKDGASMSTRSGNARDYGNLATDMNDGDWHTIAIVQSTTGLKYYVDGTAYDVKNNTTAFYLKEDIGSMFADTSADDFDAAIGRYGKADSTWKTEGSFDFWQFYDGALTASDVTYLTNNSASNVPTSPTDADQMNGTMPSLKRNAEMIASVDFTSANGAFVYDSSDINAGTINLTKSATGVNTLTVNEAKALGKEYSIVFRAKMGNSTNKNQPIIYMAGTASGGFKDQSDVLMMGIPGVGTNVTTDQAEMYYYVYKDGATISTRNGNTRQYGNLAADINDGAWHTIAIVQSATGLKYYVDGTAYDVTYNNAAIYLKEDIGGLFADATSSTFDAAIGRYGKSDTNWKTDGDFDFWQFYNGALSATQVQALSAEPAEEGQVWTNIIKNNSVWAVVGGPQVSGYKGINTNFSLFRLLNNGVRGGGWATRDNRVLNCASPNYTMSSVVTNYDSIVGKYQDITTTFFLIPEVPEVFKTGYSHTTAKVTTYKNNVQSLISKNSGKTIVLWTPLATNDTTLNKYVTDYADAVREIAAADTTILFFDANKFMNENLSAHKTLANNWFEDAQYISPLCATDLAIGFFAQTNLGDATGKTNLAELASHDLRIGSDTRNYKDGYMKDNLSYTVTVSGKTISVNADKIKSIYSGITNLRVAVIPEIGIGSNKEPWIIGSVGETITVPHSNPKITVYGDFNGSTYRFQDVALTVSTTNTQTAPYTETDDLTHLEVVGAPAIGFDTAKTSYDVTLYQYQQKVRIVAEGGDNLTVKVNNKAVEVGEYSQYIDVDANATVTVTVSGGSATKTYTLNLTRPDYADIIVTEVMSDGYLKYDVASGDNYELIEIYNASGKDLNLLDYSIGYVREYPDSSYLNPDGEVPYYFIGNEQKFHGNTFMGINQITKYSSYWDDKVDLEPETVNFPADSTMVIWVKYASSKANGAALTYDTLIAALKENAGTYTLTVDGNAVVPAMDQLVVAEIPNGSSRANVTKQLIKDSAKNFYMDSIIAQQSSTGNRRAWLFVMEDSAVRDPYAALTAAGDDIISAAKYSRIGDTDKLSSVMSYDADRGMSVVKDADTWDTNYSTGHTSNEQGYANLTSFGAIEYWQKPYDLGDSTPATIVDKTPLTVRAGGTSKIELDISDNEDIRYVELYVDKDNDGTYETVLKDDLILNASAANAGLATDIKDYTYTLEVADINNTVNYYGIVYDGNNNKTTLGSAKNPNSIEIGESTVYSYTKAEIDSQYRVYDEETATWTYTAPEKEGYVFGGWYKTADTKIGNAVKENETIPEAGAYALFVPEDVLSVKSQISANLYNETLGTDEVGAIRFITTVDSLNYQEVGFVITATGISSVLDNYMTPKSNKVYTQLFAVDPKSGAKGDALEYKPSTTFCSYSKYFRTFAIYNIAQSKFAQEMTVQAYWKTLDGTIVKGSPYTTTINAGIAAGK